MPRKRLAMLLSLLIVLALVVYSYYSPRIYLSNLKSAAEARDTEKLRELVDFDALKTGLKDDMRSALLASTKQELSGNPFAGLGMLMVNAFIDPMVDMMVSPQSIIAMLDQGKVEAKPPSSPAPKTAPIDPPTQSRADSSARSRDILVEHAYDSYDRYRISIRPETEPRESNVSLYLRRSGLFSWKLYRIALPQAIFSKQP